MQVIDEGRNPLIIVSSDEVLAWLRGVADKAGYADRESCAVQINVTQEFAGGAKFHSETPELIFMVSNIPNSRNPE